VSAVSDEREIPGEGERPRRRPVPINWDDLEMAMTWRSDELEYFLDLRSGEVRQHRVSAFADDADDVDLSEDEADEGLAEGHLVRVEPIESSVEYRWMEEFADSVTDARLRDLLEVALHGRGAFRRFKDVLARESHERERWFRFHDERVRAAMRGWLEEHDIEPTTQPRERRAG
jgi:uncharacterized protein UPF0158